MAEFVMWLVVGWFALSALVTIGRVGKGTIRVTPATAVVTVVIYVVLIVLVLVSWGGSGG